MPLIFPVIESKLTPIGRDGLILNNVIESPTYTGFELMLLMVLVATITESEYFKMFGAIELTIKENIAVALPPEFEPVMV
ncbi:MAG: hypothetical protein EBT85_03595 [Synechococcaceae bacterium WB5_2B_268]|nr:hypothetical protein [Synechococcaceae bacterium WB5_2B_268]